MFFSKVSGKIILEIFEKSIDKHKIDAILNAPSFFKRPFTGLFEVGGSAETSKYPEEKKETSISKVAASEMEVAQTEEHAFRGCGPAEAGAIASRIALESAVKECKSHVDESKKTAAGTRVPQDTRNPAGSREDHLPRLNTTW